MEKLRQHYQTLREGVVQLQAIAAQQSGIAEFQALFLQLPQRSGAAAAESEAIGEQVQSFQTEINKQMRLLELDLMFLKTARQATTLEQRWQMMGDRLHLLTVYCDALLSQD
jgi:hypothetical protein